MLGAQENTSFLSIFSIFSLIERVRFMASKVVNIDGAENMAR